MPRQKNPTISGPLSNIYRVRDLFPGSVGIRVEGDADAQGYGGDDHSGCDWMTPQIANDSCVHWGPNCNPPTTAPGDCNWIISNICTPEPSLCGDAECSRTISGACDEYDGDISCDHAADSCPVPMASKDECPAPMTSCTEDTEEGDSGCATALGGAAESECGNTLWGTGGSECGNTVFGADDSQCENAGTDDSQCDDALGGEDSDCKNTFQGHSDDAACTAGVGTDTSTAGGIETDGPLEARAGGSADGRVALSMLLSALRTRNTEG